MHSGSIKQSGPHASLLKQENRTQEELVRLELDEQRDAEMLTRDGFKMLLEAFCKLETLQDFPTNCNRDLPTNCKAHENGDR